MADEVLTIRELIAPGQSNDRAPEVLTFTAAQHALPEGEIAFPLSLNYTRINYPGSDGNPSMQVMGWERGPLEISGEWDDRFMGAGKAYDTVLRAERLLQRGRKVEIQHGKDAFVAVVVNFDPRKKHAARWLWSIKLEPFDRTTGVAVREQNNGRRLAMRHPDEHWNGIALAYDAALDYQLSAPTVALTLNAHARVGAALGGLSASVSVMSDAIEVRADATVQPVDALRRMSSASISCAASSQVVLTELREMEAATEVAWESPVAELEFETWRCGVAFNARLALTRSLEASDQLAAQVDPDIIALHRAGAGESLQAIAWRYYGDPTMWQAIAARNKLGYLTLQGDELLIIPAGHA